MTDWTAYHYHGATDHDDPTKYENQVRQTGRFTATVWALHLNVPSFLVPFTLALVGGAGALTYEYSSGGSWADWSQPAQHSGDNHLVLYFRANTSLQARVVGMKLAARAYGYGGAEYAVSTAGDHKTLVADLRQRGGDDGGAEEAKDAQGPA